jgi:hypothetical protein
LRTSWEEPKNPSRISLCTKARGEVSQGVPLNAEEFAVVELIVGSIPNANSG